MGAVTEIGEMSDSKEKDGHDRHASRPLIISYKYFNLLYYHHTQKTEALNIAYHHQEIIT